MDTILACDGILVGTVEIPSFNLQRGSRLALAVPAPFGPEWDRLMQVLSGATPHPGMRLDARHAHWIPRARTTGSASAFEKTSVLAVLEARGLAAHNEEITQKSGIFPARPYSELGLTERYLLEIASADASGSDLIIFSTGGLDPRGIKAVARCVENIAPSSIHLFPDGLGEYYRAAIDTGEILRCTHAVGM
jgi:hypothetical protein